MRVYARNVIVGAVALTTVFGFVPGAALAGTTVGTETSTTVSDPLPPQTFPTAFFMLRVRWGNVIGDPQTEDAAAMNGSVTLSSGKLDLVRTLRFEDRDVVTSQTDTNIAWNSTVYGGWDGVLVRGTAVQGATATITVGSTSLTKSVSDLVRLEKDVIDLGSGRELVIQAHPVREPAVILQAFWGRVGHPEIAVSSDNKSSTPLPILTSNSANETADAAEQDELEQTEKAAPSVSSSVNFSGNLKIVGSTIRFAKPIAFEDGDSINAPSGDTVSWTSMITNRQLMREKIACPLLLRMQHGSTGDDCNTFRVDRDGVLVGATLSAMNSSTAITVNFTDSSVNFSKTFTLADLWHKHFLFEPIPVNGVDSGYGLLIQVHPLNDGALIRAKGKAEVFRIEDGERHHVTSADAFKLRGLDWADVQEVNDEEVDAVPEGDDIDFPDGTAVKGNGPAVFVTSEDGLCPVASPQAFEAVGLKWNEIVPLPDATINAEPKCKTVMSGNDLPDGSLVRAENQAAIYKVDHGVLLGIPSPTIFEANGLSWNRVRTIPAGLIASLAKSGNLELPNGAVVRGSGPTVYVVDQGKRRPFLSEDDFTRAGFHWDDVKAVGEHDLDQIPKGSANIH